MIAYAALTKLIPDRVFGRAMHCSAKRGIAIACRPSVYMSVCDVDGPGLHKLENLKSNCTAFSATLSLYVA